MKINYNNRTFKPVSNTENGETSAETFFHYKQNDNILTADYQGGKIKKGHLIGTVDPEGIIHMVYHQINMEGQIMTGKCTSTPEILENGKVRLHEKWQWTTETNKTKGESVIEEI